MGLFETVLAPGAYYGTPAAVSSSQSTSWWLPARDASSFDDGSVALLLNTLVDTDGLSSVKLSYRTGGSDTSQVVTLAPGQ